MSDILAKLGKSEFNRLNDWVRDQAASVMTGLEANALTANRPKVFLMALHCNEDWAVDAKGQHFAALCIPRRMAVYVLGIGADEGENACKRLSLSTAAVMYAMFDTNQSVECVEAAAVNFFLAAVDDEENGLRDFVPPSEIFDAALALPKDRLEPVLQAVGKTILRVMGFNSPSEAAGELSAAILGEWGNTQPPFAHSSKSFKA